AESPAKSDKALPFSNILTISLSHSRLDAQLLCSIIALSLRVSLPLRPDRRSGEEGREKSTISLLTSLCAGPVTAGRRTEPAREGGLQDRNEK
ncbi:hypothetical protein PMAYCL1PPCAC_16988, partial [Pristionchus mayeri]